MIGIILGLPAILYATTCPFIYLLTLRMQKRGLIVIGCVFSTLAMLMIGGQNFATGFEPTSPALTFTGLCLLGLSGGMISIPVLPEMIEVYEQD